MNSKNSFYNKIYSDTETALYKLSKAIRILDKNSYLSKEDKQQILHTLYLLYQKLVFIGSDISRYEKYKDSIYKD